MSAASGSRSGRRGLLLAGLGGAALAGCSTAPATFEGRAPRFEPERFFSGRLRSHGLFTDRFGAVREWFTAELEGGWDGEALRFAEVFTYDDGWIDRRQWELRRDGPGLWRGTATDAVGAVVASEHGNAFHLLHTLDLPRRDGGTRRLAFDQWFVRLGPDQALSRAAVSWRGLVEVGTAQVSFRRLG